MVSWLDSSKTNWVYQTGKLKKELVLKEGAIRIQNLFSYLDNSLLWSLCYLSKEKFLATRKSFVYKKRTHYDVKEHWTRNQKIYVLALIIPLTSIIQLKIQSCYCYTKKLNSTNCGNQHFLKIPAYPQQFTFSWSPVSPAPSSTPASCFCWS